MIFQIMKIDKQYLYSNIIKMNLPKKISNSANKINDNAKQEKLIGFSNWLKWSAFTKAMLIKKDVWDLVFIEQQVI